MIVNSDCRPPREGRGLPDQTQKDLVSLDIYHLDLLPVCRHSGALHPLWCWSQL